MQSAVAGTAAMTRYYISHAGDLWHYFVEVAPFLEATGDRECEIRISKDDSIGSKAFDGEFWRLRFPDCCVVTGSDAEGEWIEETRSLPDMAWPFWATVSGLLGGLFISFVFLNVWLWLPASVVGLIVGYTHRQSRQVTVHFRRSEAAAADTSYPGLRVFPGVLLVRLGGSAAKKAFVRERIAREEGPDGKSVRIPAARGAKFDEPESISMEEPVADHSPPKKREELPPIPLDDSG